MKKNYFKSLLQVAVLLCAPLVIASCDDMFGDVDNPVSSYIKMNTESVTIMKGKTYTRTAIAASSAVIEYTVDDPEILEIDAEKGTVTGLKDGKTMVWACATGYDGSGNKTYKTEKVGYEVIVQDPVGYIAYTEPEEKPDPLLFDITDPEGITIEPVEPDDVWGAEEFTYRLLKWNADAEEFQLYYGEPNEDGVFVVHEVGTYQVEATVAKDGEGNYIATEDYIEFEDETAIAGYEVEVAEAVEYLVWDATEKALVEKIAAIPDGHKIHGDLAGGVFEAGVYYIDGETHFFNPIKLSGEGKIEFIVKAGADVSFNGIDEDDPAAPHTLNFFKKENGDAEAHVNIWGSTDAIKNVKEINTYGVSIHASTNAAGCGGFSLIGAINIYDAHVSAENWTDNGYGVKMKTGGIINLVKGSFYANGKNGEDAQPIAAGKLVYPEGYVYEECDNPGDMEPDWTDVEDETITKRAISCHPAPAPAPAPAAD